MRRGDHGVFLMVALVLAAGVVYGFVQQPTYTDAYYYFNAADRFVGGQGLTDPYLWNYIGAPEGLPTPSHLYWMPMASLVAAVGMWGFGVPGAYWAAQVPYVILLVMIGYTAFWLGAYWGETRRHAWAAGVIVIMGGYFARFWGVIETFTPYGFFGAICLVALGRGMVDRKWRWFALAGVMGAGGHLARADGVLLVVAGLAAIIWFWDREWTWRERIVAMVVLTGAYALAMLPWFIRNMQLIGTILPTGGTQGIWYLEYNDIFNYPPDASLRRFFEMGGWELLWESRWTALQGGLGTLIGVEGMIILFPLMMIGLVGRIREPFLRPFWIYALGLHLAMTLVFPFPGYRGGLFHSAAALMPFWAALALMGLDDVLHYVRERRQRYHLKRAQQVYTALVVVGVMILSVFVGLGGDDSNFVKQQVKYAQLRERLRDDARVMINDPSEMYYHTGLSGVVLPNETPAVIPEIAARYGITHLFLERVNDAGVAEAATTGLSTIPSDPPDFLIPMAFDDPTMRLYRIELGE